MKFFIRLGNFKKTIIIPFLLGLTQITINIFNEYYPEEAKNQILESYAIALGEIGTIIIPHIKYFSIETEKTKLQCECTKKNFCDYFLLYFLYFLEAILYLSTSLLDEGKDSKTSILMMISESLCIKGAMEIICITIIAYLLLKYKYFIHHYFAIISFTILSLAVDFMLGNFKNLSGKGALEISLNIMNVIVEVVYLCYIKYMIDKRFHYYWNIMLFLGIILVINNTLAIILILITPKENASSFFTDFWDYFDKVPVGIIISKFIIYFILEFFFNVLRILTIFYLSPEYILITGNLSKIYMIFANNADGNKYYCIIFFILQFFSLMIYLEIIELDFCALNNNTKRSIQSREFDDFVERNDTYQSGNAEINGEYIVKADSKKENDIENVEMKLIPDNDSTNLNE